MTMVANDNRTKTDRYALMEFLTELETAGYTHVRMLPRRPDTWAALRREGFMWGISSGELGHAAPPDRVWLYTSCDLAVAALKIWDRADEPPHWVRHPATNRFRPKGNPSAEVVEP